MPKKYFPTDRCLFTLCELTLRHKVKDKNLIHLSEATLQMESKAKEAFLVEMILITMAVKILSNCLNLIVTHDEAQ